jgi:uncharacterized protein YoaH (UPF0181 family)
MSDIVERLRNLESAAADEAANLIEALRKANSEVMATGIKSVRDVAELAIELREARRERDEARAEVCAHEADTSEDQRAYAKLRGWQCFAHTDGAPQ